MKKTLLLLVALFTATIAFAYDAEINGIYYNLNDETKTAEVTYQYFWPSDNYSGVTTITIPEKVTYNATEYSVTSIGDYAFSYCKALTSITIPNSVTYIGDAAFWDCSSLTSITIPNSVTSIRDNAFSGTTWLENQPDGCIYINSLLYIYKGEMPKNTHIDVKEGTTMICGYAFYNCSSLTSITIPNSVTSIGHDAFAHCSSLTSITIPNSVTSIGSWAFDGTPWLENQLDGCLYIGKCLYQYKGEMPENTHIDVNEGTTMICFAAFLDCSSLISITIPNSVTEIGEGAFSGCSSLTSITIPNSVTSIGNSAFYNCSSLTSITIPNSVNSIEDYAFYNCSSLTSITIPNSVTSIGYGAFSGCSSLTSITIPNSVNSIGDYAFYNCSSLTYITIEATTPPTLGTSVFEDTNLAAIYIPDNTLSAYKEAWGTNYIFINNENSLTIHVETPGTLSDKIFDAGQRPINVIKLTVTGTLNDDDFSCMRETMTSLVDVDLSGITNTTGVNFNDKRNLFKILLPENLTSIEYEAFSWCSSLTSITLPNSVTSIGDNAFSWCSSLTSITIGNSVTSIGDYAFSYCKALTSITIPNSVNSIEDYAFYNCSSLTSITIPNSVTSIGNDAFYDCSSLTSITCLGSTPPEASDLGANTSTCTLFVPKVAYNSYLRHEYWGQFLNIETIDVDYKKLTAIANNAEWGVVKGGDYYNNGDEATLTATANSGYRFVKWSDEVTDNPRTVVVTQDSTFTAIFEANSFVITTAINDDAMGSVTEGGEYAYGTEITLTATANSGYRFVKWSDEVTDNPRTVVVTQGSTFTAIFEVETYTITTAAAVPSMGNVKVTLIAEPIEGLVFDHWSDGNTENPRTLTLTEDIELYAYFKVAENTNVETSKISSVNIYTTNGTLHVENATENYHILDAAGRLIYSGNASTLQLPRGIYLITMGGEVEKIVL